MGIKPEEFVARFGAPMPPREFGEKVVSVLDDPKYAEGLAFGLKGDTRVTTLAASRLAMYALQDCVRREGGGKSV